MRVMGVQQVSLAPDGSHIAYIAPTGAHASMAVIVDLVGGARRFHDTNLYHLLVGAESTRDAGRGG